MHNLVDGKSADVRDANARPQSEKTIGIDHACS